MQSIYVHHLQIECIYKCAGCLQDLHKIIQTDLTNSIYQVSKCIICYYTKQNERQKCKVMKSQGVCPCIYDTWKM